jgi:hypothetical protein
MSRRVKEIMGIDIFSCMRLSLWIREMLSSTSLHSGLSVFTLAINSV